jgi:hypothetical protein
MLQENPKRIVDLVHNNLRVSARAFWSSIRDRNYRNVSDLLESCNQLPLTCYANDSVRAKLLNHLQSQTSSTHDAGFESILGKKPSQLTYGA